MASRHFLAANQMVARFPESNLLNSYLIETVTKTSIFTTASVSVPDHGGEIAAKPAVNRGKTPIGGLSPQARSR
jgi:hypothetical protein